MKTVIVSNDWMSFGSAGWGNGYVVIPEGHKLHGKDYEELSEKIDVHYGLTFS